MSNGLNSGIATALAGIALAAGQVEAKTVAWYHLDEVEPGTRLTQDVTVLNAVDSSKLPGTVWSVSGSTLGTSQDFMPIGTNDVADSVRVLDPAADVVADNPRSLFLVHADNSDGTKACRRGGCVQIASDSSLSLTNLTVEFFVKPVYQSATPGGGWQLCAKQSYASDKFTYSICLRADGRPYVNIYNSNLSTSSKVDPKTGSSKFVGNRSFLDGRWHHLAFTAATAVTEAEGGATTTNVTLKLYADGNLESTVELDYALEYTDNAPLYLGASQMGYYASGGFLDEVRISDEALEPWQFLRYLDTVSTHFHADFEKNLDVVTPTLPTLASAMTGTAGKKNKNEGENPTFSTEELPGIRIVDGLGNTLRQTNACSLRFVGSTVTYPHDPDLEMPEMTVEFFMKYQAASNYAGLLRFNQANDRWSATPIWTIIFSNDGSELRVVIYTTTKENQWRNFGSSFLDGKWHHVAMTIQQGATSLTVRLYDNYKQVGEDWTIDGRLDYSS